MNRGSRKWIKLWVDPWLSGTMRFTLDHKQRAVWADLLALGGQSRTPGIICAGEESGKVIGFPLSRIAGLVDVPDLKEMEAILDLFQRQERITVERENGRVIIRLLNWPKYQAEYSKQARYKAKKKKEKEATQQAGYRHGYQKATSTEGEGEGEVKNHCANLAVLHDGNSPNPKHSEDRSNATLRVWNYYLQKLGKNPKILSFTDLRKNKGVSRLRECLHKTGGDMERAEGLMRIAIDALAASAFHMGENDQKKRYDSWEKHLFKTQEQLEQWLERS